MTALNEGFLKYKALVGNITYNNTKISHANSKWLAHQKTLLPMPSSPFFSSFFLAHEAIE